MSTAPSVEDQIAALDRHWAQPGSFLVGGVHGATVQDLASAVAAPLPDAWAEGHYGLLTSGSTGAPKVVVGSRARSERLTEVLHEVQASEPVAETVLALPVTYSYALVNQWLWARHHDRRLVPTDGFADPARLRAALAAADHAMVCLVGAHVSLLHRFFGGAVFPGVIRLHFAGGRFPQESLDALEAMFPAAQVFNNYGCAEALPRLTVRPGREAIDAADIGRPLPGVELRTATDGALEFRSPYGAVAVGETDRWVEVSPETWVPTGDLGHEGTGGHWVLDGRASEVFKRHGEKVSVPELLSTVFAGWPGQAAGYRERDPAGEDAVVVVLAPRPEPEALRAILLEIRRHHPRAVWPLRIEACDRLPELANGKIDLQRLSTLDGRSVEWRQRI